MEALLQILGGVFYLLNKIFFSLSERARKKGGEELAKRWRIASWTACLIGLPAWAILFVIRHDWIAASLEASAIPSILLGIITTRDNNKWLNRLSIVAIIIGLSFSIYDLGGLGKLSQWLEIALASTFLAGTYLLARDKSSGYLWYVVMHISCALLTINQDFPMLAAQQLASLLFIIDAYRIAMKK